MPRKKNDAVSELTEMPEIIENELDAAAAAPDCVTDELSDSPEGIADTGAAADEIPPESPAEPLTELPPEAFAEMFAEPKDLFPQESPPAHPADGTGDAPHEQPDTPPIEMPPAQKTKPARARKKTIYDLNLNELDRNLTEEERREWSAVYASFRAKSVLSGTVIGTDQNTFDIWNRETGEIDKKTLTSLIVIEHRVKVLIPETEMWMTHEERPDYVLRNMTGTRIDYVIKEIDREGQCAIGSRRMALAAKRHYFATARGGRKEGDLLKCRVIASGAKHITVECGGYDLVLTQRDLSYTAIADLRERYHPGQELTCKLKEYDREASRLVISAKEMTPNPFIGADVRHPVGSRRQAVISGKYAGGVFCTLPDDTVCMCLYSTQHSDMDFDIGDGVIIAIREHLYDKQQIFGRILAKWW